MREDSEEEPNMKTLSCNFYLIAHCVYFFWAILSAENTTWTMATSHMSYPRPNPQAISNVKSLP